MASARLVTQQHADVNLVNILDQHTVDYSSHKDKRSIETVLIQDIQASCVYTVYTCDTCARSLHPCRTFGAKACDQGDPSDVLIHTATACILPQSEHEKEA